MNNRLEARLAKLEAKIVADDDWSDFVRFLESMGTTRDKVEARFGSLIKFCRWAKKNECVFDWSEL